jgi:branched-chain amino acid aminotransferase
VHDDTFIFIDGAVLPAAEARVPVLDRGFLYGDSVFEVTRTVSGAPLLFAEHLERLERSAAIVGHGVPPRATIEAACAKTLARAAQALGDEVELYLRIIVTRGEGPLELDPDVALTPRLVVVARPLRLPAPTLYEQGAALCTVDERRNAPGHVPAEVKSSNYLPSVLALRAAKRRGGYEALLCDLSGFVCEGASSNLFVLRDGTLFTPPLSLRILPGVTRAAVLALCADEGLRVVESPFRLDFVRTADEVFLTSSLRGVMPVTRLDDQPLGSGQPGAVTRLVMSRYAARYLERKSSASPTRNSSNMSPT